MMGIALRPPIASVDRHISAPPEAVWRLLVDIREWPHWGPSVRRAELDGGGSELHAGARGTVWTVAGVRLPFIVTEFDAGHRWNWAVAGVPATGHQVTETVGGCRVRFEVPWWALAYLPVCATALARIDRLAR
jgi:uncharacterized protein YndB with AHSA1/START domain